MEAFTWFNLITCGVLFVACVMLARDAKGQRKAVDALERTVAALQGQTKGHGDQLVTMGRAIALLVPPDARPTMADQARARLAPPAGHTGHAAPSPDPASGAPASGPAPSPQRPGPRMRVEVKPTGFASDRHVTVYTDRVQSYVFDARDVNERDSSVRVQVLGAREDEVLVELPPEIALRGQRTWVNKRFVLDMGGGPPPPPAAPAAPVDTEGDRGGINPGDDIPDPPAAAPAVLAPVEASPAAAPSFEGRARIKVKIEDGVFISERSVSFMVGNVAIVLFADERFLDAAEGTILVDVIEIDGDEVVVDLPGEIVSVGGRRVRLPLDMVLGLPDDERTGAFSREGAMALITAALSGTRDSRNAIGAALAAVEAGIEVPEASLDRIVAHVAEVRARHEAEADQRDERDAARAGEAAPLPRLNEDDPTDERTRVYSGKVRVRRPTLLGGLAGAPMEKPVSQPTRPPSESPTLVSIGATPASTPRPLRREIDTELSEEELARIDRQAARLGLTRDDILATLAEMGLEQAQARAPAPTTPPSSPANDRAPTARAIRAVFTGSGAWDTWRVEELDGEHIFTVRLMIYASGNGVYLVLAPGDALLHEGRFRFDAWDEATARGLVTGILAEQRPGAAVTFDSGKRPPRP